MARHPQKGGDIGEEICDGVGFVDGMNDVMSSICKMPNTGQVSGAVAPPYLTTLQASV